jgi:hypothetical protein
MRLEARDRVHTRVPDDVIDLAIALGDSPIHVRTRRRIRLSAEAWIGFIARENQARPWGTTDWPFGAMAAAALGAGEAFKAAMHKLLSHTINPSTTAARFANTDEIQFDLAPADTPFCQDLGQIDCVSGGASLCAGLLPRRLPLSHRRHLRGRRAAQVYRRDRYRRARTDMAVVRPPDGRDDVSLTLPKIRSDSIHDGGRRGWALP